ncbi:hypothetical protein F5Y10DRAFT_80731 [Nemania abortiva]|nr:hypothetical protein F5Y10DRAFT_80731 [Nemania abortiva]
MHTASSTDKKTRSCPSSSTQRAPDFSRWRRRYVHPELSQCLSHTLSALEISVRITTALCAFGTFCFSASRIMLASWVLSESLPCRRSQLFPSSKVQGSINDFIPRNSMLVSHTFLSLTHCPQRLGRDLSSFVLYCFFFCCCCFLRRRLLL